MKTTRMKMTVLFGVLMVVVSFGLIASSLYTSSKALTESTESNMETIAIEAAKSLDSELFSYIYALEALSNNKAFGADQSSIGYK